MAPQCAEQQLCPSEVLLGAARPALPTDTEHLGHKEPGTPCTSMDVERLNLPFHPERSQWLEHVGISFLVANKASLALFETRSHEGRGEQGQDLIFF